jgi:hypothetical protein
VMPQPLIEAYVVTQSMLATGVPLVFTVSVKKPPNLAIAAPILGAAVTVGQTTSGVKQELILDVGVGVVSVEFEGAGEVTGTLDGLVVIPHPDIVKNEVTQLVSTCRLPITCDVVQSTALDTQEGRLLVGGIVGLTTEDVEFTPHPKIE